MSTMNKGKIKDLVRAGNLIKQHFDEANIKEACYEASTSNDFFEITANGTEKIVIPDNNYYILRPNNQVVCVTREYFDIPLNVIARIFLTGHYFALGIAPVNTYADPGFKGRLGIIFSNTSRNYIKIAPHERIIKIEFATMQEPSEEGYVGQHGGDVTTWPFRRDLVADADFLEGRNICPESPEEIEKIYGKVLKNTIFSAKKFYPRLGIATAISTIIPLITVWGLSQNWDFSSPALTLALGIMIGIVSNTIFYFFTKKGVI